MNWDIMIAELVISISRFFMSDLVGAFLLQASIVKAARLTEVPAAVRSLDDAIFQKIKGDGSCPMMAKNIDDKIEEAQKLRDAGVKAHEDGKHAESEKLLNQALKLFKS